jgi:hypothetical protein
MNRIVLNIPHLIAFHWGRTPCNQLRGDTVPFLSPAADDDSWRREVNVCSKRFGGAVWRKLGRRAGGTDRRGSRDPAENPASGYE